MAEGKHMLGDLPEGGHPSGGLMMLVGVTGDEVCLPVDARHSGRTESAWIVEWAASPSETGIEGVFASEEAAKRHLSGIGAKFVAYPDGDGFYRADEADFLLTEYEVCS